jgi:hypothetical protein
VCEVGTDLSYALEINFFRRHFNLVLDESVYDQKFISSTVTRLHNLMMNNLQCTLNDN